MIKLSTWHFYTITHAILLLLRLLFLNFYSQIAACQLNTMRNIYKLNLFFWSCMHMRASSGTSNSVHLKSTKMPLMLNWSSLTHYAFARIFMSSFVKVHIGSGAKTRVDRSKCFWTGSRASMNKLAGFLTQSVQSVKMRSENLFACKSIREKEEKDISANNWLMHGTFLQLTSWMFFALALKEHFTDKSMITKISDI